MHRSFLLAALVWASCSAQFHQQPYCYSGDGDPYVYFATKTAYEFVNKENSGPEYFDNCEPFQFWFVSRHGTRYPDTEDIREMNQELDKLSKGVLRNSQDRRMNLCPRDLSLMTTWNSLEVAETSENRLTRSGWEELDYLARRYKGRLLTLLGRSYHKDLYQFRTTDKERTEKSAEAFVSGLFNGQGPHVVIPTPIHNDPLLHYYSNCTKWKDAVEISPLKQEVDAFEKGPEMLKVLSRVSQRLGFQYNLTFELVDLAYEACRFQKAWDVEKPSAWCAAFTKEDLRVLEYLEDLKYYYKYGYGTEYNLRMGCPLVKDMMNKFRKVRSGEERGPYGVFYFSHSSVMQLFLTSLGVGRDGVPLTHDYIPKDRKWRTSLMGPFATNVGAVLLNCSSEFKVQFYLQEQPMMDMCHMGLCTWDQMEEKFAQMEADCDLYHLCDPDSGANAVGISGLLLAAMLTLSRWLVL